MVNLPSDEDDLIDDFKKLYRSSITNNRNSSTLSLLPIIQSEQYKYIHYVHISRSHLIFLAIVVVNNSEKLININSCITYLDLFHNLLCKYFNLKNNIDRDIITDNFNLIYELFDESMDFGIPQLTDYNIIQEYIKVKANLESEETQEQDKSDYEEENENENENEAHTTTSDKHGESEITARKKNHTKKKSHKNMIQNTLHIIKHPSTLISSVDIKDKVMRGFEEDESYMNSFVARTITSSINWRPKGIYYAKNEFFLDVVEKVEYCQDLNTGEIRENFIVGTIFCKSYLSGMPVLTVGLMDNKLMNTTYLLNRFQFHQCVQLDELQDSNTIKFTPPDGEFELANYKLRRRPQLDPPVIQITEYNVVTKPKKWVRVFVKFRTFFKKQTSTSVLRLKIPVKRILKEYEIDLKTAPKFKTDWGTILFNISDDFVLWDVGSIKGSYGDKEYETVCQFKLFDKDEYLKEQELLKNSMDPPPLRTGPKLEKLYENLHREDGSVESLESPTAIVDDNNNNNNNNSSHLISVQFEIPYYTCSGLKIEYLKIQEDSLKYQSFPWIRYKTINDKEYYFQI
ncbi:Apm2p SCDLUD_004195 [Saccharomycodes ludwigii]|nr:hypothetical protein SCDLUD_004195 [Saccharomycodes ludwigii]KAH3899892.1 hypothetical protein SCDLUD_004195 [Saccharomycodes ludwigii]